MPETRTQVHTGLYKSALHPPDSFSGGRHREFENHIAVRLPSIMMSHMAHCWCLASKEENKSVPQPGLTKSPN